MRTEEEKVTYLEELEKRAGHDKFSWLEFELTRLDSALEVERGRINVRTLELQDKLTAIDDKYSRRADCQSKRIISLERQIDNVMWISFIAVAVSIVTVVAGILGG